jgi:hypothetical protein
MDGWNRIDRIGQTKLDRQNRIDGTRWTEQDGWNQMSNGIGQMKSDGW